LVLAAILIIRRGLAQITPVVYILAERIVLGGFFFSIDHSSGERWRRTACFVISRQEENALSSGIACWMEVLRFRLRSTTRDWVRRGITPSLHSVEPDVPKTFNLSHGAATGMDAHEDDLSFGYVYSVESSDSTRQDDGSALVSRTFWMAWAPAG
jgi:hypothetical protein